VLLRLPLLPLPPTLSDDVLRYLWDGKVAAAGFNPYALAPAAEELTPLRDATGRRLPHSEVPTVYPPLSVAAFSIASRLPFPLFVWKLAATAADLLGCWLLLALARSLGLPEGRTVWYAWNPLVALEVAGMGHVDVLGVTAVVGAVLCLVRRPSRPGTPAVLAAAGALAKLVPLAALPMWARQSGRPWRFLVMAGALVALAAVPVLAATGGVPPGLVAYGVSWEFNGPLFEPLWRLLDAAGAAPALARGLDRWKESTRMWETWNPIYPYLYPQLLAKLVLAAAAAAVVLLSLRERDPVAGTGRLLGRLLLLSATVYPWYVLWVLPWAALRRQTAWLALSALILLSYIPQHAGVPLWPWVYLGIWGPFGALLIVERLRTNR
jgi:alpha-1,6-mannosyltransferase